MFDTFTHYEMIAVRSLVTICPHTEFYSIIHCIPSATHYTPVTYLFHSWKFVPLVPLYLFCTLPSSPLTTTCSFSVSVSLFLFCPVCSFVLFFRFHIQVKFVFLWFISLSVISARSIHVVTNGKISFLFYGWIIFQEFAFGFSKHFSTFERSCLVHLLEM